MKFGEKVRELRKRKGLTQSELAQELGVNRRTIHCYETGSVYPRKQEMYQRLAEALDVSEEELRSEDELFLTQVGEQYGTRGMKQAEAVLSQAAALFAGGELSEEDQLAFVHEIQALYLDSKECAKKFTPKKYMKEESADE